MRNRLTAVVFVSVAVAGGCTTASTTPATTPPITTLTTVSSTTPTSTMPSTTTSHLETTTTVSRLDEIQAIFEDLERRRLQAIYDQDEEAFRSLYANDEYLERSMVLLDEIRVLVRPSRIPIEIAEVISDSDTCLAVRLTFDTTDILEQGGRGEATMVAERRPNESWGLSWVGDGWTCDGPHPFSS